MKKIKLQESSQNNSRFTKIIIIFLALFVFLIFLNYLDITGNAFKTTGSIQVSSTPLDAKIYIDGVYYGLTSKEIRLEEGTYTLKLERSRYIPFEKEITIQAGKREKLKAIMVRER